MSVHSDTVHPDEEESETIHVPGTPLDQSDKPRAGSKHPSVFFRDRKPTMTGDCLVAAEYLAKGYKLSDGILQRAIQLDSKFTVVWYGYFRGLTSVCDSGKGNFEAISQLLSVRRFLDWRQNAWSRSDYIWQGDQYDSNSNAARQDC